MAETPTVELKKALEGKILEYCNKPKSANKKELARLLKDYRIYVLRMSVKELAKNLDMPYSTYSAYERGRTVPRYETVSKLFLLFPPSEELLSKDDAIQILEPLTNRERYSLSKFIDINDFITTELELLDYIVTNKNNKITITKNNSDFSLSFNSFDNLKSVIEPILNLADIKATLLKKKIVYDELHNIAKMNT